MGLMVGALFGGDGGGGLLPSFTTSPIRFVDFTIEASNISRNYGTDFSMQFALSLFESRITISKDGGAPIWSHAGAASAPVGPDMPMWHEDYPIASQGGNYEAAYIGTESWFGLVQGLNDIRWAGWQDPDTRVPDWRRMNTSFAVGAIVENPAGIAHTSEHVGIYEIREFTGKAVVARARVTMRAIYT
jgi:hypothetical protein